AAAGGGGCARRRAGSPGSDEPDLGLQPYAAPLPDHPLGEVHQPLHVLGRGAALVDDEIRMPLRDARPPDPGALQTRHVDQPPGVVPAGFLKIEPAFARPCGWLATRCWRTSSSRRRTAAGSCRRSAKRTAVTTKRGGSAAPR